MLVKFKESLEGLFRAAARSLLKAGLTANMVTLIGLAFSAGAAYTYYVGAGETALTRLASILLLVSGFFDCLDGVMARMQGGGTRLGSFLDSVADRYGDGFIIAAIALGYLKLSFLGLPMAFWGLAALFGSLLVSYIRAKGESLNVKVAGVGLAERPERILIIAFLGLLGFPWLGVVAVAFLSNLTAIQRFLHIFLRLRG
ncbi:MAG: CDP-alcohol phosphatidyltransferase family protein [Candidatus Hecatellales archaeon]|nr:MAG: CDP-alcohol phosphatidyltransferase family protein [Candidatus Hecatellales archaeon]